MSQNHETVSTRSYVNPIAGWVMQEVVAGSEVIGIVPSHPIPQSDRPAGSLRRLLRPAYRAVAATLALVFLGH